MMEGVRGGGEEGFLECVQGVEGKGGEGGGVGGGEGGCVGGGKSVGGGVGGGVGGRDGVRDGGGVCVAVAVAGEF